MLFRTDSSHAVCTQCTRHKAIISKLSGHLLARKKQQELFASHLRAQLLDRQCYWANRGRSRQRGAEVCLIADGMDQGKYALPRSPHMKAKAFDSWSRPKLHCSAVIAHGHHILFSISDSNLKKDSNTSIELVAHSLQLLKRTSTVPLSETHVQLQADNTCRELKNAMLLRWAGGQVGCNNILKFTASFLRSGHSHEDLDQVFGSLSKCLVRVRTAQTSDDVVNHIRRFLHELPRPHESGRYAVKLDQTRDWPLKLSSLLDVTVFLATVTTTVLP